MIMETIDGNCESAKNQESNAELGKKELLKDNITIKNHFGPWMLVKRNVKRKESKSNNNSMNDATTTLANGSIKNEGPTVLKSRFAVLEKENEGSAEDKVTNGTRDNYHEGHNNNMNKMGPSDRGKEDSKKDNENATEHSSRDMVSSHHVDTKAQDEENRRRMKIFQESKKYNSDKFMAQVILPSTEIVEPIHQRYISAKQHTDLDEPLDRGFCKESTGGDDTCSSMEMKTIENVKPNGSGYQE
ncbi:hypothetical protein RIF29_18961 [Crotalaria pallida]|uniref:Uncharacterized protein n=1 Tax=Crotalaria pallida TaxID=3830 RepID=A0AAN9I3Q2_CROPI